jgi:subtilisin family serine protease
MARFSRSLIALCAGAALTAALAVAPSAYAADNGRTRVIVAYKPGASVAARDAIAKAGGRVLVDIDGSDALAVSLPRRALAALRASSAVDYVEADVVRTVQGARSKVVRPNLVGGTPQTVPYGITQVQADQISGTPLWKPKVCIIDSGINATHEDLAGNTLSGKNFTTSGTWDTDEDAHGTHVAGTIAALNNTVGVVGVGANKQFNLVIAKVFDASGSASASIITKAINYCGRQKANIISMSLGSSGNSRTEQRALDKLQAAGVRSEEQRLNSSHNPASRMPSSA